MTIFENLPHSTIYFSKLQGVPVFTSWGKRLGRLSDLFVDFEDLYPLVLALQFRSGQHYFSIGWDELAELSYQKIVVKNERNIRFGATYSLDFNENQRPRHLLSDKKFDSVHDYPGIGKLVLDKQIVDTHGKKVVRVNDIHLIKVSSALRVSYADIGLAGLLRRTKLDLPLTPFFKLLGTSAQGLGTNAGVINWKHVHTIPSSGNVNASLELNISGEDLQKIHPADLADILEDLNNIDRRKLFNQLDDETKALTLQEIDRETLPTLLDPERPEETARILENMDPDEAADLLNELDDSKADQIIAAIQDDEIQEDIQDLLEYEEDSAGGIMSPDVFTVFGQMTRTQVLQKIEQEGQDYASIYDIYVVDADHHLKGSCSLVNLLTQSENITIEEIMLKDDLKTAETDTNWKKIALTMSKYNLNNIPIVDPEFKLLGIVTVDDILPWLLKEK